MYSARNAQTAARLLQVDCLAVNKLILRGVCMVRCLNNMQQHHNYRYYVALSLIFTDFDKANRPPGLIQLDDKLVD